MYGLNDSSEHAKDSALHSRRVEKLRQVCGIDLEQTQIPSEDTLAKIDQLLEREFNSLTQEPLMSFIKDKYVDLSEVVDALTENSLVIDLLQDEVVLQLVKNGQVKISILADLDSKESRSWLSASRMGKDKLLALIASKDLEQSADEIKTKNLWQYAFDKKWDLVAKILEDKNVNVDIESEDGEHKGKSLLWLCALHAQRDLVSKLLDRKYIDINIKPESGEHNGKTVFWLCVLNKQWDIAAKMLNKKHLDVATLPEGVEYSGRTSLWLCALNHQWDLVEQLLKFKDVDITVFPNAEHPVLYMCAVNKQWSLVEKLLQSSSTDHSYITKIDSKTMMEIIFACAEDDRWDLVKQFLSLKDFGKDLDSHTVANMLELFVHNRKWDLVEKLIVCKDLVTKLPAERLVNPLWQSAFHSKWSIVTELLKVPGIKVNLTPMIPEYRDMTLLWLSVSNQQWDIVKKILKMPDVDVNLAPANSIPVVWLCALERKWDLIAEILKKKNVILEAIPSIGTPLIWMCALDGQWELVKKLVKSRAVDINFVPFDGPNAGRSLLWMCVFQKENKRAEELLKIQLIDVNLAPLNGEFAGRSVLWLCAFNQNWDLFKKVIKSHKVEITGDIIEILGFYNKLELIKEYDVVDLTSQRTECKDLQKASPSLHAMYTKPLGENLPTIIPTREGYTNLSKILFEQVCRSSMISSSGKVDFSGSKLTISQLLISGSYLLKLGEQIKKVPDQLSKESLDVVDEVGRVLQPIVKHLGKSLKKQKDACEKFLEDAENRSELVLPVSVRDRAIIVRLRWEQDNLLSSVYSDGRSADYFDNIGFFKFPHLNSPLTYVMPKKDVQDNTGDFVSMFVQEQQLARIDFYDKFIKFAKDNRGRKVIQDLYAVNSIQDLLRQLVAPDKFIQYNMMITIEALKQHYNLLKEVGDLSQNPTTAMHLSNLCVNIREWASSAPEIGPTRNVILGQVQKIIKEIEDIQVKHWNSNGGNRSKL